MKSKVLIDRDTLERLTDPVTRSFGDVHMAKTIVDYDKILHREMGLTEFIRKHGHAPFDPDTGDALPAAPLSPDHSGGGAGMVLPRYTCIGKGGEYELLGSAIGAGTLKDMSAIPVYRDITTGQLFVRTPLDFSTRMESLDKVKELNQ